MPKVYPAPTYKPMKRLARSVLLSATAGALLAVWSPAVRAAQPAGASQDTLVTINRLFIINTDNFINPTPLPDVDLELDTVVHVNVNGHASIDGPEALNDRLARERAEKMKEILTNSYGIEEKKISIKSIGEDWNLFRYLVMQDGNIPARAQLLDIIDNTALSNAVKEARIRKMDGGRTWRYLTKTILPQMRYASVEMHLNKYIPPQPAPAPRPYLEEIDTMPLVESVEEVVEVIEVETDTVAEWVPKMYIKTNAPAWALLWQNVGIEFDLARHWSFALPVYWSPYNFGKQTLKFRTLAFVPEFRYWPRGDNMGFFINAHFGLAYYNYAKDGEFRYQDHDGRTPAIGGGLGIGYRFYFCRNHHWTMEVAVGAGAYRLDYDIFDNTDQTKYGYLLGRRQRTFFGLDQAALTFSYSFGLRKKKGGTQ